MDDRKFDSIVRALASGITRRSALGALAGLVGWEWAESVEAKKHRNHKGASHKKAHKRHQKRDRKQVQNANHKVGVCHHTGSATNPLVFIEVAASAIPAHEAHGDAVNVDLQTDENNCGTCGNVCTGDACNTPVCNGGVCGTEAVNCDDKNACTTDTCDPVTGCAHTPISCDDRNACTDDSCDPATGCVHKDISCDDGDVCTEDRCDLATGCVHTRIPGCCVRDEDCPAGEICSEGQCVGDPACQGQTCETFTPCGAEEGCVCLSLSGGGPGSPGLCGVGATPCDTVGPCTADNSCPTGSICIVDSCCSVPSCFPLAAECAPATLAGATASPSDRSGPTFGHR